LSILSKRHPNTKPCQSKLC